MCINVLRLRPRPFKFGWVSISLCYAEISVFCPDSFALFPSSNVISSWSMSSVCVMDSWVYNGAPQPCFSSYTVDYTLVTDQMTIIFVFHSIRGHEPGGWICYQCSLTGKDLLWFQWKSAQTPKQELPKDFLQPFVMKFVYYLHLTSYLISQKQS